MKRVAFFAEIMTEDFDGASRTMFQLINRIDTSKFDYLFVYGSGPDSFSGFKSFKVPTLNIPINKDYCLAIPQLVRFRLEKALDQFNPEVIHISTPSILGFFALNYAKKRNIPVLSIYHTHFISYSRFYLHRFTSLIYPAEQWIKKRMKKFYNSCDKIYVPTVAMITALKAMGIAEERMSLWQRGIDRQLFSPSKADQSWIRHITQNDKPNILFASRLVWEKNIRTLIDIYEELERQKIDCNFIVIGDGKAREEAQYRMPNAYFLGKKSHEELARFYASADIFVFPSTSETYGNVVTEAMASGLPCVIGNEGGSASLIDHGRTGFKCHAYNAKEYVYFMARLLENPGLTAEIKENALAETAKLDWDKLSQRYFTDIDQLTAITPVASPTWAWAN